MIDKEKIEQFVTQYTANGDMFLVEVKVSTMSEIEVVVDSDTYLGIDDCIKLSKAIEGQLDREAQDFELSVYSAGIGEPLKLYRQYVKTVGRPVEAVLKSGIKVVGILAAVDEAGITVDYQAKEAVDGKKRKITVTKSEQYKFDDIKTIKEELDIK